MKTATCQAEALTKEAEAQAKGREARDFRPAIALHACRNSRGRGDLNRLKAGVLSLIHQQAFAQRAKKDYTSDIFHRQAHQKIRTFVSSLRKCHEGLHDRTRRITRQDTKDYMTEHEGLHERTQRIA